MTKFIKRLPKRYSGSWFKCTNPYCKYTSQWLTLQNTVKCPECGSTAVRC